MVCTAIVRVHPVHLLNLEQRQAAAAANLWTKPTDFSGNSAYERLVNHTNHRHVLLLNPKADTYYPPMENRRRIYQGGGLHAEMVYLPEDGHTHHSNLLTVTLT